MTSRVPLVILTGFLGAGKTTALNRVLGAQHRRRVAVLVNELGRIDVDGKLLRGRSGDVIELVGGCVCHEVRTQEELWEGLREIVARSRPDVIVLETTGIAEPGAIIEGLRALPDEEGVAEFAGVVTVVDAEAGLRHLADFSEARQQVRDADRLLLSKLDGAAATPAGVSALHARLESLNPDAERASFPASDEGTTALCDWLLGPGAPRLVRRTSGGGHDHHHAHAGVQIMAASFVDEAALLPTPLLSLCQSWAPNLLRIKGFVNIAGESRRGFLERAGVRTEIRFESPWAAERPRTELVLIGHDLDPAAIRRQLWACRAPAPGPRDGDQGAV